MDVQRPIPDQRIRADWGRAVAEAIAAQGLSGRGVLRTPVGTSLPPAPIPGAARSDPPDAPFSCVLAAGSPGPVLRVRAGDVRDAAGDPLGYSPEGGFKVAGDWFEAAAPEGAATVAAESAPRGRWTLRILGADDADEDGADGPEWRVPIAEVETGEGVRRVRQLRTGDIALPARHWGATDPLVEIPADDAGEWRAVVEGDREKATAVAESRLVDIDVDGDGRVTARHYRTQTIDASGNVVAISERTEAAEPDPEEGEDGGETPNCGHPLNGGGASGGGGGGGHPLDGGGEDTSGGGGGGHPLDYEGRGGYTPRCSG